MSNTGRKPIEFPYPEPPPAPGLFPAPENERRKRAIEWWQDATVATWQLIQRGQNFDARHITELVGREYPGDGRRIGAFVRKHHKHGHIKIAGYQPSRSATSGAVVATWRPTATGIAAAETVLKNRRESSGK